MLEVGKTYRHHINERTIFKITERCTDYFVGENTGSRWLFDINGNATGMFGSPTKPKFSIVPIPKEDTLYIRLNRWGDTSVSKTPNEGTAVIDIKVTLEDGIAVSAELNKANVDKIVSPQLVS